MLTKKDVSVTLCMGGKGKEIVTVVTPVEWDKHWY